MAYQSLYRRYRPQRFAQVRGQDHLVRALQRAVAEGRVGHAYLLSGPRGTGKTTTARILAKALNCPEVSDGEPCGVCDSCQAIAGGTSFDLHELDAASNRGIGEMKALLEKIALGTPGHSKVYILDEVHMLTKEASAALLKTLEEPPDHVVFVLATTDPHKVLPTIRSRTQHFELQLLPAEQLSELVDEVAADAGLEVSPEQVEFALRKGGGSARDTLSMLDQVAAAGGAPGGSDHADLLLSAIVEAEVGGVLTGVQESVVAGAEPRVIGEELVERLRDAFLVAMSVEVTHLTDETRQRAAEVGERLGPRAITRALELLGEALIEMRKAADPRIPLEVALVRIVRPETESSVAALHDRVDRLERQLRDPAAPSRPAPSPAPERSAQPEASGGGTGPDVPQPKPGPADGAREALARASDPSSKPALGAHRVQPAAPEPTPKTDTGSTESSPTDPLDEQDGETQDQETADQETPDGRAQAQTTPRGDVPSRDSLTLAWGDTILPGLSQKVRSRWSGGRFLDVVDGSAVFALPNQVTCDRCADQRVEVEQALTSHFGTEVAVSVVVDEASAPPPDALDPATVLRQATARADEREVEDVGPVDELENAGNEVESGVTRLTDAFPGAKLVDADE